MYLSSKLNEFDKLRIRDFLNVALYTLNEHAYIQTLKNDESVKSGAEIEEGITMNKDRRVFCHYE